MEKKEITQYLHELIASNKITEAFDILMNFIKSRETNKDILSDVIQLKSRFSYIERQQIMGVLSNAEYGLERNRIVYVLLQLVDDISKDIEGIGEKGKVTDTASKETGKTETKETNSVVVTGDNNIIIQGVNGSKIEMTGDYKISDEVKKGGVNNIQELIVGGSKIRVLYLAANPGDVHPIKLENEEKAIKHALGCDLNPEKSKFEFRNCGAVTTKDLLDYLLAFKPHIVHFAGHGTEEGIILVNKNKQFSQPISAQPLAELFSNFSNHIACVFFNICKTEHHTKEMRKYIGNVIGMNGEIPNDTAIEFAEIYYTCIENENEVFRSFEIAKSFIKVNNRPGSDIPFLL